VIAAILLRSRGGARYFAGLAVTSLIAAVFARYGLKINMAQHHPAIALTIPELCAVTLLGVGIITLRPRLWIIDRQGVPSRRWIPAVCAAVAVIAGPQIVLAAATVAALPAPSWARSATTTLVLAAASVISAVYAGPLRTIGLVALVYFATALISQIAPDFGRWSPLALVTTPSPTPLAPGKVMAAILCSALALAVTARTLGQTMRRWSRGDDPT
jgi:hypothetical protein